MFENKKGQATIFIIAALVIVVVIGGYFILRNSTTLNGGIPESLQDVYSYYDSCIRQDVSEVVDLVETQGGRVETGFYAPGSEYAPTSSHLNFMGFGVPYWSYLSANGVIKENVPTKAGMQREMESALSKLISECNFDSFLEAGYFVILDEPDVKLTIKDQSIIAKVSAKLTVERNNESATVSTREIEVPTSLGKLFDESIRLYQKQSREAFIENYSADIMRLYAPVEGVLIQCNPEVWNTVEVVEDLQAGLEANFAAMKFGDKNSYDGSEGYSVVDFSTQSDIRVMYSKSWPQKIEIHGDNVKENAMIADVTGNQQGMGIMGFCYVPYHFVYDLHFPVLFQVMAGDEIFQFPIVSVIDKNLPRKGAYYENEPEQQVDFDFCAEKTQDVTLNTFDAKLNPIDADISYTCFNQRCELGRSVGGILETKIPSCTNGRLVAEKQNYSEQELEFSSNREVVADLILDRIYNTEVEVLIDGQKMSGTALVSFEGKRSGSAALPESKEVELAEGSYTISVYVYGNSSIVIPASKSTQCVEVSQSGISGLFGAKDEKCFEVNMPETKIEYALLGGGVTQTYIFAENLESGKITLDVGKLPSPKSLAELQTNYELFESQNVGVNFE